ncbi:MAG: transcription factor WhiB [Mycobacterium sp.]|jgi:WhiB family redox-sensing transcriptional regulator|nr:transcription factor WhiB [Mycobacterium sp.]
MSERAASSLTLVDIGELDFDFSALAGEDDPAELGWQQKALCAQTDPESFFPEKGGSTREAKRVCQSCEVQAECLEYALTHDERFGIWGGLSERERRRVRRIG